MLTDGCYQILVPVKLNISSNRGKSKTIHRITTFNSDGGGGNTPHGLSYFERKTSLVSLGASDNKLVRSGEASPMTNDDSKLPRTHSDTSFGLLAAKRYTPQSSQKKQ